ncbi:uncharacterized protein BXZ73DRAFT_80266 [Epithele typhae]|uniref:uncharacterized protein n=1 Tax=Epithele typhae TaxID=378194 RepID=UPI002007644C|nr:uncharacterized protein BXZ73DRAFT_80266 [Epithele typhae]KAH9919747.1 hypothetical protein BXZ73DRAFT_80266 [Epithele typhae]
MGSASLLSLNDDVLFEIFSLLDRKEALATSYTSKRAYRLAISYVFTGLRWSRTMYGSVPETDSSEAYALWEHMHAPEPVFQVPRVQHLHHFTTVFFERADVPLLHKFLSHASNLRTIDLWNFESFVDEDKEGPIRAIGAMHHLERASLRSIPSTRPFALELQTNPVLSEPEHVWKSLYGAVPHLRSLEVTVEKCIVHDYVDSLLHALQDWPLLHLTLHFPPPTHIWSAESVAEADDRRAAELRRVEALLPLPLGSCGRPSLRLLALRSCLPAFSGLDSPQARGLATEPAREDDVERRWDPTSEFVRPALRRLRELREEVPRDERWWWVEGEGAARRPVEIWREDGERARDLIQRADFDAARTLDAGMTSTTSRFSQPDTFFSPASRPWSLETMVTEDECGVRARIRYSPSREPLLAGPRLPSSSISLCTSPPADTRRASPRWRTGAQWTPEAGRVEAFRLFPLQFVEAVLSIRAVALSARLLGSTGFDTRGRAPR